MPLADDPPWRLNSATPADAGAIAALTRRAYARWVPVLGREPLPMTVDYQRAVLEHRFDLVRSGRELLALVETRPEPDGLLIVNLAVDAPHQGRGLGPRLLAHAEQLARAQGLVRLRLYTHERMAANVAFYRRHGYAIDRLEAIADGHAVHMSKPTPDPERLA